MTAFSIYQLSNQLDRVYVEVDRRFNLVIERTRDGLALHVYPRRKGELWCDPFNTFKVEEAEVLACEQELEE
jgi:hypothetical protein